MTVYAITDTKKGRTGIAPTYLQTTPVKDIDIDIADILGKKYRLISAMAISTHLYCRCSCYPPLVTAGRRNVVGRDMWVATT